MNVEQLPTAGRTSAEKAGDPGAVDDLGELDDRQRFEAWAAPHWSAMASFAARLAQTGDAEDLAQEALLLAWQKRDRFDPARGSARAWLLSLVVDRARRGWRSRRLVFAAADIEVGAVPTHAPDAESRMDLERALASLTARQRLTVELFYYADLSTEDVATVMRCSAGTVKSTLADARKRLQQTLGEDYR